MAFGAEPVDSNSVPISSAYDPNTGFVAVQSSPFTSVDSSSNISAAAVVLPAPSTHGLPFVTPSVTQKASGVTGSAAKTLAIAFSNAVVTGNSIIVSMGMGEVEASGITLAVTDSLGNTYTQAGKGSQSTTQEAAIFYATNSLPGANTVTITIAGASSSTTAIAAEIYEVQGLITVSSLVVDQSNSNGNAGSTAVSTANITPNNVNELSFMAIASAGGTITAGSGWILDSGSLAPTGGNLVSFASQSHFQMSAGPIVPVATLGTSNAWAACTVAFRAMHLPQEGIHIVQGGFTEIYGTASALNADIINMDVSAYQFISIHINNNAWSGTLTAAWSNDNINWVNCNLYPSSSDDATSTSSSIFGSTNTIYETHRRARYFRLRMTSYTSGTAQATIELFTQAPPRLFKANTVGVTGNITVGTININPGDMSLLTSGSYTTTQTGSDRGNFSARGLRVVLDVTSAGTGSITLEIDGKDFASGKYIALLTGTAVTTISTNVYVIYPGLTPSANAIVSDVLPVTWRVKVVANNANAMTYSIGGAYLL